MIPVNTYFLDFNSYLCIISFIFVTIGFIYKFKFQEKEQRFRFLNILCKVMGLLFFMVLIISLFNITQKNYNFNMEIVFMSTIIGYIVSLILYIVPDEKMSNIIKLFMYLLKIILFISSAILCLGVGLLKNIFPWINTDSIWILGIFLMSCWFLIDLSDLKK